MSELTEEGSGPPALNCGCSMGMEFEGVSPDPRSVGNRVVAPQSHLVALTGFVGRHSTRILPWFNFGP